MYENTSDVISCWMNQPTCLTLEPLPAGGTLAGVWSQTLATVFTFLQADRCSQDTEAHQNLWQPRKRHKTFFRHAIQLFFFFFRKKINLARVSCPDVHVRIESLTLK